MDFLPQFAYKKPIFKAGSDVRYNNCAFILLSLAIEKITGQDYHIILWERKLIGDIKLTRYKEW